MPQYCFNKPNRKNARYFQTCDAARIANEVVKDNPLINRVHVLACIAKRMGFTHVCLLKSEYEAAKREADGADFINKAVVGISILDKALNFLNDNFIAGAGFVDPSKIPDTEIKIPTRGTIKLPPINMNKTAAIAAAAVALLIILKKIVDSQVKEDEDSRSCYPVDDVIIKIYCKCKFPSPVVNNQNLGV
jgi:hypothetical protein